MGDAPSLGDIEVKYRNQLLAGFFRHRISPGTERYQKFTFCIKRHIAVHHATESQCSQSSQLFTVFCLHIVCQALVTPLQSFPDVFQAIGPNIVLQTVLPVVSSHGNGGVASIYQYRFDSGRTEFNTQNRLSRFDRFFCCFVHCILSFCFYIVSALFTFITFCVLLQTPVLPPGYQIHTSDPFSSPLSSVKVSLLPFSPDFPSDEEVK